MKKLHELKKDLMTATGNNKLQILYRLALEYNRIKQFTNSTKYSIELKKNTQYANDRSIIVLFIKSLILTAKNFLELKLIKNAFSNIDTAAKIIKQLNFTELKPECFFVVAEIYLKKGKLDLALEFYNKSLKFYKEQHQWQDVAKIYNKLSIAYYNFGKIDKAYNQLYSAFNCLEISNDNSSFALTCDNFSNILIKKEKYEEALKYLDLGFSLITKSNNLELKVKFEFDFGILYFKLGKNEKAIEFFKQALSTCEDFEYHYDEINIYEKLAEVYNSIENYEKASYYSQKSLYFIKEFTTINYQNKLQILSTENDLELKKKEYQLSKINNRELTKALDELKKVQEQILITEKENTLLNLTLTTNKRLLPIVNDILEKYSIIKDKLKNEKNEKYFSKIDKSIKKIQQILEDLKRLVKHGKLINYSKNVKMFELEKK